MTIDEQIRDEKLQYDIDKEAAKLSALSSGKIDIYIYIYMNVLLVKKHDHLIKNKQ